MGSILTMPTSGMLELDPEKYASTYSNQKASPGYFTHTLDMHHAKVELSSTLRAGISRYTFQKGQNNILINLGLGLTNETGAMIKLISNQEVEGYKTIGTFCYNPDVVRPIYFVAKLLIMFNLFSNFNQILIALSDEWLFLLFKVVKKLRETFVLMFIVKD